MIKVHARNILNLILGVLLLVVGAFVSLVFGMVSLFYVILIVGFGLFLWVEGKRKHPLSEPKQAIYSRMLDKE